MGSIKKTTEYRAEMNSLLLTQIRFEHSGRSTYSASVKVFANSEQVASAMFDIRGLYEMARVFRAAAREMKQLRQGGRR